MIFIQKHQLAIRRLLVFIMIVAPIIYGYSLFYKIVEFREIEISEYYQLIILFFLFSTLSYGASISIIGFISIFINKYFRKQTARSLVTNLDQLRTVPVAIVIPIFEEDIQSTFHRIRVMFQSIENKFPDSKVDFFILSDTRNPENWLKEEIAFNDLCEQFATYSRIFYRRRKINLNKKSGNVSDFCRRWGQLYKYMIILDADSLMTSECIFSMIAEMEMNPNLGILQSPPKIINGKSVYQKIIQFTSSLFNPILLAGSEFWQQESGSYWGHNAIIRMKSFIEYCALPKLPSYGALGGRVLSHDTIECALMRKAGFEVRVSQELKGSYEESPPNILEALKRDNRWCQGNLQHLWFLFVNIPFVNKIHIMLGILAYFNSLLWGFFILLSIYSFWNDFRFFSLSMLPEEFKNFTEMIYLPLHFQLLYLTLFLLFIPRVLAYLNILLSPDSAKSMGGIFRITISLLLETIFSILVAPIFLVFYSIFILYTFLNRKIEWDPQNRYLTKESLLRSSFRTLSGLSLLGVAIAVFLYDQLPIFFYSTLPIWMGWILSFPLTYITSLNLSTNRFSRNLFLIEEDLQPCEEIKEYLQLEKKEQPLDQKLKEISGRSALFSVIVHPFYHDLHINMQGKKKSNPSFSTKMQNSMDSLLASGPELISGKDLTLILTNRDALKVLHNRFWKSNISELGLFWRIHWRDFCN